jgi:uridylate kinase
MQVLERSCSDGLHRRSACAWNPTAVVVFNLFEEGNIERVVRGEPSGTIIRS